MYKGSYGHFGVFDQEIVMEQAIRIELVEKARGQHQAHCSSDTGPVGCPPGS